MMGGVDVPFAAALTSSATSFTTTNIQVEGVDEPDVVKTDGTYLYVASGSSVFVILASPADKPSIVSRLDYKGQVLGIFISLNRLVVIENGPINSPSRFYTQTVNFLLYDMSTSAKPALLKSISVEGSYVNSRLTNGYVYAIIQQPTVQPDQNGNLTVMPANVVDGNVSETIPASGVYYNPNSAASFGMYTIILSLNVGDGSHSETAVLTGWGSTIYASTSNIYLAFSDSLRYPILGGIARPGIGAPVIGMPFWRGYGTNTTVFRIAFSAGQTQVASEGMIPGTVLNQFSLDEYQGYLRVATTSYSRLLNQTQVQVNNVYVLDQGLKVVGSLEGLAPKEKIYSVRFLGEVGYMVTFERIDPLFAISFVNPTRPAVLGALALTGFSDYLHPIGNGLLIGVGKETVPAPQEAGYVLYMGVKLSLFHVYDNGSSVEISKYVIGDRGSDTPVSTDHRAFVYDVGKGVVAFPILVAQIDKSGNGGNPPVFAYGTPVWQGAYLFKVSPQSGFQLLGRITQIPSGVSVNENPHYYINRIVIIGDYVYAISNRAVSVNNLPSLSVVAQIQLPA